MPGFYFISNPVKVPADLVGFRALITEAVSGIPVDFWAGVTDPNGLDIRFWTNESMIVELQREIVRFTTGPNAVEAWVRCDLSGSLPTRIYCSYGGGTRVNDDVLLWTDTHGVYHLEANYVDSSGNGKDGSATAAPDVTQTLISRGYDWPSGTARDIALQSVTLGTVFSISLWMRSDNSDGNVKVLWDVGAIFILDGIDAYATISFDFDTLAGEPPGTASDVIRWRVEDSVPNTVQLIGSTVVTDDSWHYVTVVRDGTDFYLYVDGALDDSGSGSVAAEYDGYNPPYIGTIRGRYLPTHDGLIDEVRIHSRAISADEIAAEYTNQIDPGTFWIASTASATPDTPYLRMYQHLLPRAKAWKI